MKRTRLFLPVLLAAFVLGLLSLLAAAGVPAVLAQAGSLTPTPAASPTPAPGSTGGVPASHADGNCLLCHSNKNMQGRFTDGETLSLYYDASAHGDSVHTGKLGCTACHAAQAVYPHPGSAPQACLACHPAGAAGSVPQDVPLVFDLAFADARGLTLQLGQACTACHSTQATQVVDSDHAHIMAEGNRFAPVCVDCHGAHDVAAVSQAPRSEIPKICAKCHLAIYTTYQSSVHGSALDADSNPDVPTCADCHGSHVMQGPAEKTFRADSIEICGKCHADPQRMSKYGISTAVMTTYLDDFHGRTVNFFRVSDTVNVPTATCYDCHGVHNIRSPSDPDSTVYPANLQKTCQQCHPNADIKFPQAWMNHEIPTWDKTPALYAVNLIYSLMIPGVIGGFMVYIGLDARRRFAARWLAALRKYLPFRKPKP